MRSVTVGTVIGFISSSCSFAALATTRSLFAKGARLSGAMAFMLASTNLVIELGVVIAVFLGGHFVVGEYVGGVLLIMIVWGLMTIWRPKALVDAVRDRLANEASDHWGDPPPMIERFKRLSTWRAIGRQYGMEWSMVWKDVTIGFTVAGIIASFVPDSFFQSLFIGSGGEATPGAWAIVQQAAVGPAAAFFTFIGSMGNVPLAALLFSKGVSFAGVMAFLFSDLVVFPVLRIQARYYGWKMALWILAVLYVGLVVTALLLHAGFAAVGQLPEPPEQLARAGDRFALDHTFVLNMVALAMTGAMVWLARTGAHDHDGHAMARKGQVLEGLLTVLTIASLVWIGAGWVMIAVRALTA